MPGVGLAAPNRVALGENARMMVGGNPGALDGINIRFVNGTIDVGGATSDVQDNMSEGFDEKTRTKRTMTLTADCTYRTADNPLGNLPRFQALEETQRIIIWPDLINDPNQYYKMPIGFCDGFTIVAAGNGDVRFTLRLSSQTKFYYPGRPDPNGVQA